jgi:type IV secretion system protein VirB10
MTDAPTSPDHLNPAGGVRRLNRMPLVIAGAMLLLILLAVTYTYQTRLARMREQAAHASAKPTAANPTQVFRDAPDGGYIPAKKEATPTPAPPRVPLVDPAQAAVKAKPAPEEERLRKMRERLRRMREQAALAAIRAPTRIKGQSRQRAAAVKSTAAETSPLKTQVTSLIAAEAKRRAQENGESDLNRAEEKAAWLNDRKPENSSAHYLPGGREMPRSPYEVKAGTVIPAIMVGGINSDLPGQIIGQTVENVYDTATGRYILIPQGSKLVGTYHNAITTGQERVLVAWTRIIYPDASSVDLGKMPGADSAGFAGLHDQVNTHFWKKFGSALMLSAITAGVQLSQTGGQTTNGTDAQQTIAASLGQQFGQLGMETARRNLQIQPTIEIRPGLRFTVLITKDIAFRKPWRKK